MSGGNEFHKFICLKGDCLVSDCKEFHKLMCLEGNFE